MAMNPPTAEQYEALNARYEALRSIRETEPEAHATQMATTLEETQRNSQVLIAQLRGEIARLGQNDQEFASAVTMAESLHAENAQLRQAGSSANVVPTPEAYEMRKMATFYEMLTGVTVALDGNRVHCSCGDKQRPLAFEIDLAPEDGEPGDLGFNPTELGDCTERLPDYMQDHITCAPARATPLFGPCSPPSAFGLPRSRRPTLACGSRAGASAGAAAKAAAGALRQVRGDARRPCMHEALSLSPDNIVV